MTENGQKEAIEALHDWSKWVIGIGFAAGAGCVVIFRGADAGLARALLIVAIAAFSLSVLSAILLRYGLARMVEKLPLADTQGRERSVYEHRLGDWISIGHLARAQLGLLVLAALFFLAWVIMLPTQ